MVRVKQETTAEEAPSLKRILAEINKKFGENTIGLAGEMDNIEIARLSSGVSKLDEALGGGFPRGRMVELYGLPSGGKSLISLLTIAQAQREGGECIYLDVEGGFDPVFATHLGVDVDKLILVNMFIGEDIFETILKLLEREPAIIVIDSVAAMIVRAEDEADLNQQFMAVKARLLSRALPKINAKNKSTLLMFINQLRNTLVMYGAPTTTPGGRALPHYASIRVEIKKGDLLRVDDKKTTPVIGQLISYHITKNKTSAPFKDGSFKFYHEDYRVEE